MAVRTACVVPARLGSTRFFGKLLHPLLGKPVVVHALDRAAGAGCFDAVLCLTDSPEIGAAVAAHGFDFILTGEAANGTERIARSLDSLEGDLFVNLQGDEPAFPEEGLRTLCAALRRNPEWTHTPVHREAPAPEELADSNRVKAVVDADGFVTGLMRDIGRRVPPGISIHPRNARALDDRAVYRGADVAAYRLQLGAYAYTRDYLQRYAALSPSAAELEMSHEMLRSRDLAPLRAHPASPGASVDVPADLDAAAAALRTLRAGKTTAPPETQASLQGIPA